MLLLLLLTTSAWLCPQHSRNLGPSFIRAPFTWPELVDVVGPEVGGAPHVNIAGEVAVEPALLPMQLEEMNLN